MMSTPPVNQPTGTPFGLKQEEGMLTPPTLPDDVELPAVVDPAPVGEAEPLWLALHPPTAVIAEGSIFDELW